MQFTRKNLTFGLLAIVAVMALFAAAGHPLVNPEALAGLGMIPFAMSGEVTILEIKTILESQGKTWEEHKKTNDALIAAKADGKAVGDTCRIHLPPGDAFGEYDAERVRVETRDKFPAEIAVGMQFEGESGKQGETVIYTVTDIAEDKVVVDGNHSLAGQTLNFQCVVSEVRVATGEELTHGHVHGAHGHHH